jgi:hypothetical protein
MWLLTPGLVHRIRTVFILMGIWSFGGMITDRENINAQRKPVPVPFCRRI